MRGEWLLWGTRARKMTLMQVGLGRAPPAFLQPFPKHHSKADLGKSPEKVGGNAGGTG